MVRYPSDLPLPTLLLFLPLGRLELQIRFTQGQIGEWQREANSVRTWSIWLPYYYLFCASACTTSDWQSMSFPGCSPCAETSAYTRSTCPGKHKNLNFTIRQVRGRLTKQNKMPRTRIQPLLTISLPNRRVITVTD